MKLQVLPYPSFISNFKGSHPTLKHCPKDVETVLRTSRTHPRTITAQRCLLYAFNQEEKFRRG